VPRNNKGAKKNTISTKKYVKGHWKGFFPNNRQCQVKLGVRGFFKVSMGL
jgi:hypothetical protein